MHLDIVGFSYSLFIIIGGLYGFFVAGSLPSLLAGLLFGLISGFGAWRVSKDPSKYLIQLLSAFILACVMGVRYYKSGKILPGVVCVVSTLVVSWVIFRKLTFNTREKFKCFNSSLLN